MSNPSSNTELHMIIHWNARSGSVGNIALPKADNGYRYPKALKKIRVVEHRTKAAHI